MVFSPRVAEPNPEGGEPIIGEEGMTRLCADLDVDMYTDPVVLVLAYKMRAQVNKLLTFIVVIAVLGWGRY